MYWDLDHHQESCRYGGGLEMGHKTKEILVNGETKTIPISERMKELRGEDDLTDSQIAIISKFMTNKVSRKDEKAFGMGFAISCVLDEEISKLDKETSKARRSYLK